MLLLSLFFSFRVNSQCEIYENGISVDADFLVFCDPTTVNVGVWNLGTVPETAVIELLISTPGSAISPTDFWQFLSFSTALTVISDEAYEGSLLLFRKVTFLVGSMPAGTPINGNLIDLIFDPTISGIPESFVLDINVFGDGCTPDPTNAQSFIVLNRFGFTHPIITGNLSAYWTNPSAPIGDSQIISGTLTVVMGTTLLMQHKVQFNQKS